MDRSPQSFETVLSSMCTPPHPHARRAAERFLATNPGDPGTFPAVAELESQAVSYLGEMTGLSDPSGYIASGGTEANIQAVHMARSLAETDTPNVVIPSSAHFSFHKAASLLDIELRVVSTETYLADVDAIAEAVDTDTALVVGVAGTTEYGRVDPIPALCDVASDVGARVHVDAAWGGFVLPFTDHQWHFDHAPIDSLTIDPHKLGQAAIPAGGLLVRTTDDLASLAVDTPYLHSDRQRTLLGTRSGAGVASTVAALKALWPEGYREEYERASELAQWFASELERRDIELVDPVLPIVSFDLPASVADNLRDRGWRISTTTAGEVRIVMMPHVTRSQLAAFLTDLDTEYATERALTD